AIDPDAPPPGRARWFGLDDPAVRAALRRSPRLLHAVASPADIDAACAALRAIGQDAGEPTAARRMTPQGELRWRITLRADGMPQLDGALPTLIEWLGVHPAEAMPASGVRLLDLTLHCADPRPVEAAYAALGLGWAVRQQARAGRTRLEARFDTPRGPVTLHGGLPEDGHDE
ncbi:VOC family protein, partial [uncultured Methylibium sp.]|uniref:VOC family protein n=1 Tax=uncultured Methylibium sp. TaxID=381093 RepID=UPI0025FF75FB